MDDFDLYCGIHGITKPDEIALATHILSSDNRDEVVLRAISPRWEALITKWASKQGWWDWGVSMRLGWFTPRGKEGIADRIRETKRRLTMEEREVELHATHPSAVEATANTIKMLGGKLIERGGKYYVTGADKPTQYIVWAAVRQGYVKCEIPTPKAES